MARHAMAAACAQDVCRRNGLHSAAGIEHHPHAGRFVFDRRHLGAEFDLEAEGLKVFAQDRFGAPLRQAALELVRAAGACEVDALEGTQALSQNVEAPDAHACAKERLDQASALKHLEHCWLDSGPARLT